MAARPVTYGLLLASAAGAPAAPDPPVATEADVEQLVRWGRIDDRQLEGPTRFRRYDEAIAITQPDADALARTPDRDPGWPAWNRLCNRMVALQERRRAAAAVALHDLLGRVSRRQRPPLGAAPARPPAPVGPGFRAPDGGGAPRAGAGHPALRGSAVGLRARLERLGF